LNTSRGVPKGLGKLHGYNIKTLKRGGKKGAREVLTKRHPSFHTNTGGRMDKTSRGTMNRKKKQPTNINPGELTS